MRVKGVTELVALVLLVLLGACRRDDGGELEITSFEANPTSIASAGQPVTLSWEITGPVTDLEISASVGASPGEVSGNDYVVNPTATTTYTLTASNGSAQDEATTTVTVGGTGGEDGRPPTGSFGVALTQTGEFQSDAGSNISSPSDPRIIRVQPGGSFYASAAYSDPGGVSALTVYIANSSPPGLKADLVPSQSVGGFTVSEPTGCTLGGSQVSVTCLYQIQVGNIPNIDALPSAGNEFAYVFKVRAADPAGNSDDQSTRGYVIVGEGGTNPSPTPDNEDPVAAFTGEQTGSSEDGVTYSFSAAGSSDPDGDSLSYAWNFGDGSSAISRDFTKTYSEDGTYTVTLTVSDGRGGSDSESETLTIDVPGGGGNQVPVASFTYTPAPPAPIIEDQTVVTLDPAASRDADGTIVSYLWTVTRPSGRVDEYEKTAAQPKLGLQPSENGEYEVSLVVTDNGGTASEPMTQTFEVSEETPSPTLTFTQSTSSEGTGSVESNPAGIDCDNECVSDAASFEVDTVVVLRATPDSGSSFGSWEGDCDSVSENTCIVTMDESKTVSAVFGLASASSPLKADFEAVVSGGSVAFTSTSEGSDITSHLWEFGDGLIGGGPSTEHVYRDEGTYAVKLTIRDARRNRATLSKDVDIPG